MWTVFVDLLLHAESVRLLRHSVIGEMLLPNLWR